jgi:hypothetical protein
MEMGDLGAKHLALSNVSPLLIRTSTHPFIIYLGKTAKWE